MNYKSKVELIRNNIISAAQVYKNSLVGRYYLYVFENNYFEMYYGTDNFLHLTGVGTELRASQFYELAKEGKLQSGQLFFNQRFPLTTAMKKTAHLIHLEKFVKEGYFIAKNLKTASVFYPYAITNIDQSVLLGLKEEMEKEVYIPKSFRIKGNIFEKVTENNLFEINYILSKIDGERGYDRVLYQERSLKELPQKILSKIDTAKLPL